jgi:hypothetical protein
MHAGSTTNDGYSALSESVAESSPLGKPTASTVGSFSERIKHKASDPTIGSVSGEGGKPGKGPKADSQGIPALAGSDSKSSGAPLPDGILFNSVMNFISSCFVLM